MKKTLIAGSLNLVKTTNLAGQIRSTVDWTKIGSSLLNCQI